MHQLVPQAIPACGTILSLHMVWTVFKFQNPNPSDQRKKQTLIVSSIKVKKKCMSPLQPRTDCRSTN